MTIAKVNKTLHLTIILDQLPRVLSLVANEAVHIDLSDKIIEKNTIVSTPTLLATDTRHFFNILFEFSVQMGSSGLYFK